MWDVINCPSPWNLLQVQHSSNMSLYFISALHTEMVRVSTGTRRNNKVIMTSKRRHNDVIIASCVGRCSGNPSWSAKTVYPTYTGCLRPLGPVSISEKRLIVRSREVSKPRDWYFKSSYRFEIWQAHRQQCCRSACQISERSDNSKYGFETSREREPWYHQSITSHAGRLVFLNIPVPQGLTHWGRDR